MSAGYFHYSVRARSRTEGFNSVLYGAYITGLALEDSSEMLLHKLGDPGRVMHHEILAAANAPKWVQRVVRDRDHEALWNRAEEAEKRKNSVVCRDIKLALDDGLFVRDARGKIDPKASLRLQAETLRAHLNEKFVAQGMIATFAVHWDKRDPADNPHAHVMLTTRLATENGFGEKEGGKSRPWKENRAEEWRAHWAEAQNRELEKLRVPYRLDHRSYERQGLELEPEKKHYGRTEKKRANERHHEKQADRLLKNCRPVLNAMTKSFVDTFSDRELDTFVRRYARKTGKEAELLEAIKHSNELVALPSGRYTTRGIQARAIGKEISGTTELLPHTQSWREMDQNLAKSGWKLEAAMRDGKVALDLVSLADPDNRVSAYRVDERLGHAKLQERFGSSRVRHELDEVARQRREAYDALESQIWKRMRLEDRHERQTFFSAWREAMKEQAGKSPGRWQVSAFVAEKLSRWTWERRLRAVQREREERRLAAEKEADRIRRERDRAIEEGARQREEELRGRKATPAKQSPVIQESSPDHFANLLKTWRSLQKRLEAETLRGIIPLQDRLQRDRIAAQLVTLPEWQAHRSQNPRSEEVRAIERQAERERADRERREKGWTPEKDRDRGR